MRNLFQKGAAIVFLLPFAGAVFAADEPAVLPVAKRTIYPGDTITEDMIAFKPAGQIKGAGAYATDADSLIGKAARRTLLPGQPIPKVAIREPYIVFQNKTVPLVFESGTVTITGLAQALESGSAGDSISARNPDSGVVIRGVVQPDGSLRAN
jgi:flagella basal body P-ring formation protein FlgA